MGDKKIEINYMQIDDSMESIQSIMDDTYTSALIEQLKQEFSYSQSDYVNKLLDAACTLEEINNVVDELLTKSKNMLEVAKVIYSERDELAAESMK